MKKVTVLAAISMTVLNGCSFFEDEAISVGRCMRAANYLNDVDLRGAAAYKASIIFRNRDGSAREAMLLAEKVRDEAEPYGSSTDPRQVLAIAKDWKESRYCQKVEAEFKEAVEKTIAAYKAAIIKPPKDSSSCEQFNELHVATFKDPYTKRYQPDLLPVLKKILIGSIQGLPESEKFGLTSLISQNKVEDLSNDLSAQCSKGKSVADSIGGTKTVTTIRASEAASKNQNIRIVLTSNPVLTEEGIHIETNIGKYAMYAVRVNDEVFSAFNKAKSGQCLELETTESFDFGDASQIIKATPCQ
jgi:hypothetical protein